MSDLLEYKPGTTFPGVVGRAVAESSPAWPEPVRAKEDAPNIIFIDRQRRVPHHGTNYLWHRGPEPRL
jgi:hypothetical protein